ncbi:MAG TPA: hypothetical protein VET48_01440 [Steroidobacteraceae bacterium]|nr:hypothetical protein [Steroidobacteraceae bacterium]
MKLQLIAIAMGFLFSSMAQAFEIERAETKFQDKQYQLTLALVVDAPIDRVQSVLRDYRNYPRLDARILEAKVLKRDTQDELLLYTMLHACFGVFCKNVKRVERVQEREHELQATVLPEQSEITSGDTRTQLTSLDGKTRVTYVTRIAPGFWIPPFVGRALMLRTLRETSIGLFRNVEQKARSSAP